MCLRSQTPLGELWHSPELPSWWGGGCKPPSQKLHPTFGLWLHIFTLWVWSCCPWGLADLLNDFWSLGELTPLMRIVRLWLRMSDVIDRTAVVKETSRHRSCTGMALMPRLLQVSASMTVNRDRHLTLLLSFLINSKCTKHQFIHLLTATFKDLHIENSKNYKRWCCPHHWLCVNVLLNNITWEPGKVGAKFHWQHLMAQLWKPPIATRESLG